MGCAISGLAAKAEFGGKTTEDGAAALYPSEDQVQMIKESWKVIRDDIAKVGIIMFVRQFSDMLAQETKKDAAEPDLFIQATK